MNIERLFDALGKILSEKENVKISFTVKKKRGDVKMSCVKLYPHQDEALNACEDRNRVAFYHDM